MPKVIFDCFFIWTMNGTEGPEDGLKRLKTLAQPQTPFAFLAEKRP